MTSQDPEFYKKTPTAHFSVNTDVEDIYKSWDKIVSSEDWENVEMFVLEFVRRKVDCDKAFQKALVACRRTTKFQPRKAQLLHVLLSLEQRGAPELDELTPDELATLRKLLMKKVSKSNSGVLVITVLTSPFPTVNAAGKRQRFSCEWNCYYCPNEPGQPRSYLHDEPSVLRANRNKFDPVLQFCDRAVTLAMNGHPVDKIELLVLGGTWASYPHTYQEEFIRDLFYAANTFYSARRPAGSSSDPSVRPRGSLTEEKALNEKARCKIIGITLETRPDCITADELRRFRYYGCTRVQLGVQHTDNTILAKINRGCTTTDTKHALRLLKDSCYKVDVHLMPNLPGADPEMDRAMFKQVLEDEDLQADQWKIYPCEVTPWTVIQKWFEKGEYTPYAEETLCELLLDVKAEVHPWIRLNRIIRDIPSQYILGGVDNPSMRQVLQRRLAERGQRCKCIRCREVRDRNDIEPKLVTREYKGQGAKEYFISFESADESVILGFVRLRINKMVGKQIGDVKERENSHFFGTSGEYENLNIDSEEKKKNDEEGRRPVVLEYERPSRPSLRTINERRQRSKTPRQGTNAKASKPAKQQRVVHMFRDSPEQARELKETLTPFQELIGAALVRELHVYGKLVPTRKAAKDDRGNAQHVGLGTRLMREAERVAATHGAAKVAVIAGVGVRDYYRKLGYDLEGSGEMMIKHLDPNMVKRAENAVKFKRWVQIILITALLVAVCSVILHRVL